MYLRGGSGLSKARGKAGQGAVTGAHSMRGRGKSKASRLEAVKGRGKSKASQRQFPARAARDISHWGDARFFFRLPPKFHNHSFKTESLDPKLATEITERLANEITEITKITESRSSCLVISVSTYWPISPA